MCMLADMRYCYYSVWFVDYNGLPTQPDTNWAARVVNEMHSYWCISCDQFFMSWGDAVDHLFPTTEEGNYGFHRPPHGVRGW